MTNADEWQNRVGQVWADLFPRTDRAFAGLTQMLLEKLASVPGGAIADVGCGAGELSLALAAARPYADVCGIDISEALLARARERAAGAGNVRFVSGDAAQWQPGDRFRPDLLVSRHGVMFFDDPVAAFAHLRAVAAADARMVFTCFRAAAGNVWASGMAHALDLPPPGDPDAPGPFAFAKEDRVRSILTRAGWRDIVLEPADFSFVTGGAPIRSPIPCSISSISARPRGFCMNWTMPIAGLRFCASSNNGCGPIAAAMSWLSRHRPGSFRHGGAADRMLRSLLRGLSACPGRGRRLTACA